jgi:hypothetical protein
MAAESRPRSANPVSQNVSAAWSFSHFIWWNLSVGVSAAAGAGA